MNCRKLHLDFINMIMRMKKLNVNNLKGKNNNIER